MAKSKNKNTQKNDQQGANTSTKGPPAMVGPLIPAADAQASTSDHEKAKDGREPVCLFDPVDSLTGEVVANKTDFELPGVIPLSLVRNYSTAFGRFPSMLGIGGWVFNLDQCIVPDEQGLRLREANGRWLTFAAPEPGSSTFIRSKRYQVLCVGRSSYRVVHTATGLMREFSASPDQPTSLLRRMADARGNHIDFHYQGERLVEIVDTAKRRMLLKSDGQGRITRVEIWAQGQLTGHANYGYQPDGELAYAEDALGHRERYEYDAYHRLVKRTWKNGMSFHYEYHLETGECIKTWGDGGIHTGKFLRERK